MRTSPGPVTLKPHERLEVSLSFDIDSFVAACRAVRNLSDAPAKIADLLRDAIADPDAIDEAVQRRRGRQRQGDMAEVFVSDDDLTIYQVALPPYLFGVPHDHAGWAVVGVYRGQEAFNVYEERNGRLVQTDRRVLRAPSVDVLDPPLIHDIDNPSENSSGSIHVYSNRHFDMPGRRIWRDGAMGPDPFTLERSFEYGMERTASRRRELGLPELSAPSMPDVQAARKPLRS
jgi:predicted metal-dependent enzyme (double-stranded beta helix superfamily)